MNNVIVYTSSTCTYCAALKQFLHERNVAFEIRNVSENKDYKKELMKMGYMSVPVTVIDNTVVVGFDKEKLESLL